MGLLSYKLESIRATYESERAAADHLEETRQHKLLHQEQDLKVSPRPLSPFFPGCALYKPMVQSFDEEVNEVVPSKIVDRDINVVDKCKMHSATEELLHLKAREAQELRLSLQEIQRTKSAAEKESIEERRLRVLEMRNSPRSKDARRELKSRSGALRREERAKIEEAIELADVERRSELKEMADVQKQARQTAALRQQLRNHSRNGASLLNTISKAGDRAVMKKLKKKRLSRSSDAPVQQLGIETEEQEAPTPSSPQSPTTSSQVALKLMMQRKSKVNDFTDSEILSPVNKSRPIRNELMNLGDDLDE
jgi:YesN/AraC family two-component response regulator